jgi:hypothetical protein
MLPINSAAMFCVDNIVQNITGSKVGPLDHSRTSNDTTAPLDALQDKMPSNGALLP